MTESLIELLTHYCKVSFLKLPFSFIHSLDSLGLNVFSCFLASARTYERHYQGDISRDRNHTHRDPVSAIPTLLIALNLDYNRNIHNFTITFQCHSSETHQRCGSETRPVRIPSRSRQPRGAGETRDGAPPCPYQNTDFSLPHHGMHPLPHLC